MGTSICKAMRNGISRKKSVEGNDERKVKISGRSWEILSSDKLQIIVVTIPVKG